MLGQPPASIEIWEVRNGSTQPHNWHVHGVRLRVLPTDANHVLPDHHRGWKDTVYIPPGDAISVEVVFVDHADEDHPFMFHCHILYHEDNGMMGQFILTEAGLTENVDGAPEHGGDH